MKFLWTAVYVKNLEDSIAFYESLAGLSVQRRFGAGPGVEIAMLGNGLEGETLLELLMDGSRGELSVGEDISIGFLVPSIAEKLAELKEKRIPVHLGPVETPRSKFFYVKDPNGLSVQFFEAKKQ